MSANEPPETTGAPEQPRLYTEKEAVILGRRVTLEYPELGA